MTIENILHKYSLEQGREAQFLAELVAEIRPPRFSHVDHATHTLQALCYVLNNDPTKAALLRNAILTLLAEHKPVSLFVDSGIQPSTGFFTELWRRLGHKILPAAVDKRYLKDLFSQIFPKAKDEQWVVAVPTPVWEQLIEALHFEEAAPNQSAACAENFLDAVEVLSYRISALGLEPELLRNRPELEDHESPFITQNIELREFLSPSAEAGDVRQILVMLDQCRKVIAKIRSSSSQTGTSIDLTFLLQRISQQIRRLESMLAIVVSLRAGESANAAYAALFKTVVSGECHKNNLGQHWRENMELLALRVTENASRTGEHYITETRSEYFTLMRSAMGAGLLIAFMAMIKIITADQHYAPLTEAILFSLNYGLGFVLIHTLHFTVATKQPAMTAAAIAASIDGNESKSREMENLVTIIAQTIRSQTIAIIGNISLAAPVAMLLGGGFYLLFGEHFVSPAKAQKMLDDIDPLHTGTLFYAGIAGVCLFLAGLIAGYHDNLSIYNKIPQRLRALGWLQKLLGEKRLEKVAKYLENNLGAIAGNFYFGCLLGGMAAIGVLLGLPVDVRHITLTSAFVGFSFVGLEFDITLKIALYAVVVVLLIGMMNLLVSFGLALYVAMKSRKVSFVQWRRLGVALVKRLYRNPKEFFMPPKQQVAELEGAEARSH
ncbi:MAG: site-specific recombinase [Nitrosomonadales bacterium]|nr:site-specific recombinase [Nitrosomonadales bacterium]